MRSERLRNVMHAFKEGEETTNQNVPDENEATSEKSTQQCDESEMSGPPKRAKVHRQKKSSSSGKPKKAKRAIAKPKS